MIHRCVRVRGASVTKGEIRHEERGSLGKGKTGLPPSGMGTGGEAKIHSFRGGLFFGEAAKSQTKATP